MGAVLQVKMCVFQVPDTCGGRVAGKKIRFGGARGPDPPVPSFSLLSSQPISSHLSYLPASLKAESISALYIFSALTSVIKPHLRIVHARIGYSTSGPDSNHLASMEISNKIGIPSNAV